MNQYNTPGWLGLESAFFLPALFPFGINPNHASSSAVYITECAVDLPIRGSSSCATTLLLHSRMALSNTQPQALQTMMDSPRLPLSLSLSPN